MSAAQFSPAQDPDSRLALPWRLLIFMAWVGCLVALCQGRVRWLDTPRLNDHNLALLEQGIWGLGLTGPEAALFQPASHYLVGFVPPGLGALALAMPWVLLLGAGVLCLGFAALHGRRPRVWLAAGAFASGMLALLATPYGLLVVLLVPLAMRLGGQHSWRLTVGIGVPACVVLLQLGICLVLPAERVWRRAGDEPLAQVFLARQLEKRPDHQQRQEATELLEAAVPRLRPSLLKLAAMKQLVHLRFAAGDKQGASELAEEACTLLEQLPVAAGPAAEDRRVRHYLLAARCLFHENYEEKALAFLQKVNALVPDHPEVLAYEAERLLRTRSPENGPRARELIARALDRDPRCFRAHLARGRWAEARGDLLAARRSYRTAARLKPQDPEPHLLLINLYLQQDMVEAAEQAVKVAMGKGHGIQDPRLEYSLGLIYFQQGRQDSARKRLEQVLKLQPGNIDVRRILSKVLAAQALARVGQVKPETLAGIARRIRELDPQNPQGLVVMAVVKSGEGQFRDAIALLEEARQQLPDDPDVRRRLAAAYKSHGYHLLWQKKREPAMDVLQKFLKLASEEQSTATVRDVMDSHCKQLERRGWKELALGNVAAAEAAYQRSVELLPERPEGHHCLAAASLAQKDFDVALREARRAERLAKQAQRAYGVYRMLQVDILQHMDRREEAKELAKGFLSNPGSESAEVIAAIRKLIRD